MNPHVKKPTEQEIRRFAVRQAIASARLEGRGVSGQILEWFEEYINGEIDIEEMVRRTIQRHVVESPSPPSESPHQS